MRPQTQLIRSTERSSVKELMPSSNIMRLPRNVRSVVIEAGYVNQHRDERINSLRHRRDALSGLPISNKVIS